MTAVYNVINAGFVGSQHDISLLTAVTLGAPPMGLIMGVAVRASAYSVGGITLVFA